VTTRSAVALAPPTLMQASSRFRASVQGWLLLLPAAALLALFTHYPAIATFFHSFFSTPKGARQRVRRRRQLPPDDR